MSEILGNIVTLTYTTKVGGVLTDPTTTTVTVQQPDGTLAGPFTGVRDSIGTFHYNFTPTQVGHHSVLWQSTGTAAGAYGYEFDVAAQFSSGLANLADVKAYLQKSSAVVVDDAEIQRFLDAASELVTQMTGITGSGVVPAPVRLAVADLTADLWRSQKGVTATRPFGSTAGVGDELGGPQARWRTLLEPYIGINSAPGGEAVSPVYAFTVDTFWANPDATTASSSNYYAKGYGI